LLLLVSSNNPVNAVTTSAFGFAFTENNLLKTNFGFFDSSLKISFTLLVTE